MRTYDKAYKIHDAWEIGWRYSCKYNENCPMKKKVNKERGK